MAEIKQKLANSATATISLGSLANNAGRGSTAIDNSSILALEADIAVKIKTASSGVSATGYLDVYLIRSEDGTNYDDSFEGFESIFYGAFTAVNAYKLGSITANANATTYYEVFNTAISGNLPRKFCIGVVNRTGAALDETQSNHAVTYTLKTLQS